MDKVKTHLQTQENIQEPKTIDFLGYVFKEQSSEIIDESCQEVMDQFFSDIPEDVFVEFKDKDKLDNYVLGLQEQLVKQSFKKLAIEKLDDVEQQKINGICETIKKTVYKFLKMFRSKVNEDNE